MRLDGWKKSGVIVVHVSRRTFFIIIIISSSSLGSSSVIWRRFRNMPYSIDVSDRRVFLKISFILTYLFFFFFFPIHSSPCLSSSVVIFWFGIFIFWFLSSLFVPQLGSLVYYYSWLLFLRFPAVPFSFSLSLGCRLVSTVNEMV